MAESYSVKAVLSAYDKGFTAAMKNATSATNTLGKTIKKGFAFGVLASAGQTAFNAVKDSTIGLAKEAVKTSDSMQKLQQAMRFSGTPEKEIQRIAGATGTLKTYADKTVFELEDVMSTFGALSANGIKDADRMTESVGNAVAVFGGGATEFQRVGLAFSQAMAAGKLSAEDWNQVLDASPQLAGGLKKELVKLNPVLGKDFKGAMADGAITADLLGKAMNNIGMTDMAKEAATSVTTFEGAMGNLKATVTNGLLTLYDSFAKSSVIDAINAFNDKIAIAFDWLGTNLPVAISKAQPYFEELGNILKIVGEAAKEVGGFFAEHADAISSALPYLFAAVAAYKGFKFVSSVAPGMVAFTKSITSLATGGIKGLAGKLFKVSGGMDAAGKSGATSSKQMLAAAKSFMMVGAGVLMVAGGFALLAYSAIALANAGGLAIGVMLGMALAVGGLTIGIMAMMKQIQASPAKLNAMAKAMLAVGVAVLLISAGFAILAVSAIALANAGGLAIGVFVGMAVAIGALVAVFATFAPQLSVGTKGFLVLGAALLIAAVSMSIMAFASIALANAGTPAIAAMLLMVVAVGALVAVFAIFAPMLTAGAVGLIAFGAAMLLTGTVALIASVGLAIVAAVLPILCDYGLQGALAIAALGLAMVAFGAGAAVAGVACVALGAGILVLAAGTLVLGAAILVAAAGIIAFGAGALVAVAGTAALTAILIALTASLTLTGSGALLAVAGFVALTAGCVALGAGAVVATAAFVALTAGAVAGTVAIAAFGVAMLAGCAGVLAMAAALKMVKSSMKSISSSAKQTEKSLKSMTSAIKTVESGLNALGSKAKSAMKAVTSAFDSTASKAKSAGQKVGTGFTSGMQTGLALAPSVARVSVTATTSVLRSGRGAAYSAGAYISQGFAAGMRSQLGAIRSAATQMVNAANKAVRAKAMIHSPSRLFEKNGVYMGEGQEEGILSKVKDVWKAAKKLVQLPSTELPEMRLAYVGGLPEEYEYSRNSSYTIIVPVDLDGKEIAKVTAPYTEEELNRRQKHEDRKRGRV